MSVMTKDFIEARDALDRAERSFSFFIELANRRDFTAIVNMAWEERTIARKAMEKARKVKV